MFGKKLCLPSPLLRYLGPFVWTAIHFTMQKYGFWEKPPPPLLVPLKTELNQSEKAVFKAQHILGACSLLSIHHFFTAQFWMHLLGVILWLHPSLWHKSVTSGLPGHCSVLPVPFLPARTKCSGWVIPQRKVCNWPILRYYFSIRERN